jgi:hypothetical protein
MNCVVLQKVVYRLPGSNRPVFAIVLGQSHGLTLLFIKKPNGVQSHSLAIATENVDEGVFEAVNASHFPVGLADIAAIGCKLQAVAGHLGESEMDKFLEDLI